MGILCLYYQSGFGGQDGLDKGEEEHQSGGGYIQWTLS